MSQMIQRGREIIRINAQRNYIEYSTDGGRSWHSRYTSSFCGTFVDLLDYGRDILACTSKGLYYSSDDGRSWHSRYTSSFCGTFLQLMADGSQILATTSKGLYYSTDAGRSWHRK